MLFAGKTDVASANYLYVALALGGLMASHFDRWAWGLERKPQSERDPAFAQRDLRASSLS
jgi:hypothetical protein